MNRIEIFSDDLLYVDIVDGNIIICKKSYLWTKLNKDLPNLSNFDEHRYKYNQIKIAFNMAITLQRQEFTLNKSDRISSIMRLTALKQDSTTLVHVKKSLLLSKLLNDNIIKMETLISGLMEVEK